MNRKYIPYFILISFLLACVSASAQDSLPDTANKKHLIISYVLKIDADKKNGIAESYNGAIKTIFLSDSKARSRMVSLMRVQSLFYVGNEGENITMVKESGRESYKKNINQTEWQQMNKKYAEAVYEFLEDSIQVLNYDCKKVIVKLKDGKEVVAYYTSLIRNDNFAKVEPAFAGIPGIVLKYVYKNEDAEFIYAATDISFAIPGPEIYKIP